MRIIILARRFYLESIERNKLQDMIRFVYFMNSIYLNIFILISFYFLIVSMIGNMYRARI